MTTQARAWALLIASGVFEAVWAASLSLSRGFTQLLPVVVFLVAMTVSVVGLARAMRHIPAGTAYAVWTGVGAVLTVIWAVATGAEHLSLARGAALALLIGCLVGLRLVEKDAAS